MASLPTGPKHPGVHWGYDAAQDVKATLFPYHSHYEFGMFNPPP